MGNTILKSTALIFAVKDRKSIASGRSKDYIYGMLNLKNSALNKYIGKRVSIIIKEEE